MKKILLSAILLLSQPLFAEAEPKISTFHRLLIFNENNELMVIRFENSDRWATPGWYQNGHLTIKKGLTKLAASHGIKIAPPVLRGVFTLKSGSDNGISTRLIYSTKIESGEPVSPEGIREIKWLPVPMALETITFPHINAQISQITQHPNTVWAGSQLRYQEDGVFKSKTIEDFYPLFAADN